MEGVEPTRLAALDPKSSASANFATSAQGRKNRGIWEKPAFFWSDGKKEPGGSVFKAESTPESF